MRLIDADWVKGKFKKALDVIAVQMSDSIMSGDEENIQAGQNQHSAYATALTILDHAPTIEVEPVVHGEWIYENYTWHCGVCGFHPFKGYIPKEPGFNFCPNCRAKMDGGSD